MTATITGDETKTARDDEIFGNTFTLDDLVIRLGVSKGTLYKYAQSGRLKGQKLARRWVFTGESIRRFLNGD